MIRGLKTKSNTRAQHWWVSLFHKKRLQITCGYRFVVLPVNPNSNQFFSKPCILVPLRFGVNPICNYVHVINCYQLVNGEAILLLDYFSYYWITTL
jgi:hypothetical protein